MKTMGASDSLAALPRPGKPKKWIAGTARKEASPGTRAGARMAEVVI